MSLHDYLKTALLMFCRWVQMFILTVHKYVYLVLKWMNAENIFRLVVEKWYYDKNCKKNYMPMQYAHFSSYNSPPAYSAIKV